MTAEIFISAINEIANYEYARLEDTEDDIITTMDTVDDFKSFQKHIRTCETSHGNVEVFAMESGQELNVMDFGEYRMALVD